MNLSQITRPITILMLLILPLRVMAFAWADRAQVTLVKFLGTGRIAALDESAQAERGANGHTLATRRAFQYAIATGSEDQKQALELVLGSPVSELDTENGFVMQNVVWGNFRNEVHTSLSDFLSEYLKLQSKISALSKIDPELSSEVGKQLVAAKTRLVQKWLALAFVLQDHEGIFGETNFVDGPLSLPTSRFIDLKAKYGLQNSVNYIHSMLVDGGEIPLSQAETLTKIEAFANEMMKSILTKLVSTIKNNGQSHLENRAAPAKLELFGLKKQTMQEAVRGLDMPAEEINGILQYFEFTRYSGLNPAPTEADFAKESAYGRYENQSRHWQSTEFRLALHDLGSLFHLIQDSAVGCTERALAKTQELAKNVKSVDQGENKAAVCGIQDGHGVIDTNSNQVIALSSGDNYYERTSEHSTLDSLYRPGNLYSISQLIKQEFADKDKLYGPFDPAIATGQLLIDTVSTIKNLSTTASTEADLEQTARALVKKHILSRYNLSSKQ